jgi:transcriptional regulator with XRE-family HTH domain
MFLGKFLKEKRAEKGWTQDEISDKLGIPRTTYANYEQNRSRLDNSMISKVASLFTLTTKEIRSFAEVKAGEFQEYPAPYGNTSVSNDLWQAKQQECMDLREHNKDLKLLVETQLKLIEKLEYQQKPSNNSSEKEKVDG